MDKTYKLRRIADAAPDEVLGSCVMNVDEEPATGWVWQPPQTADEVDRLVMEKQAIIDRLAANIAELKTMLTAQEQRRDLIIAEYGHLFPAPGDGGTWKDWRGTYSGGNYRNQPQRAPEIRLVDRDKALSAGIMEVKHVLSVTKARDYLDRQWNPVDMGIELREKPPVSFSPRKVADTMPTTHHSDE